MKAQFVYENINFERGGDPKDAMDIGDRDARMINRLDSLLISFGFKKFDEITFEDDFYMKDLAEWHSPEYGKAVLYKYTDSGRIERIGHYGATLQGPSFTYDFTKDEILTKRCWENALAERPLYENMRFERGGDPKKSMGIGMEIQLEKFLKSIGRNPTLRKSNALVYATEHNREDLVKYLLSLGVSIKGKDFNGITALDFAIKNNNIKIIDLFLKKGLNQSELDECLYFSFNSENEDLVKLFLEQGANPNSEFGNLSNAAISNLPNIIKILLDYGADPNEPKDRPGSRPLFQSIIHGKLGSFKILLPLTKDPLAKDLKGRNPLEWAKVNMESLMKSSYDWRDYSKKFFGSTPSGSTKEDEINDFKEIIRILEEL